MSRTPTLPSLRPRLHVAGRYRLVGPCSAAAGETEVLGVKWGVAAFAVVVVGLLLFAGLS